MKKIINYFVENQNRIRDFLAIFLYKINLVPKQFEGRVRSIYLTKKYNKEFLKLNLKYDQSGFHHLNPMPSVEYLEKYYKDTYWPSRTDKNYPIRIRDIEHYKLLIRKFPDFNNTKKNILNFGAGHGGISFFLHIANHRVHNFEPGGMKKYFDNRWEILSDLNNTNIKFDLIYGSHSLEHVQDIKKILKLFKKISHDKTIFFFEVPNCHPNQKVKIEPPHTYYFTTKFFDNFFKKNAFCKTFSNYEEQSEDNGEVIILLSQSNININ